MTHEQRKTYEQAVGLAEAGQYEQALQQMQEYLKSYPKDGEALNDTGTILFCMHRGREAIDYFQRARSCSQGDVLSQVLYNLCEAYLAEDQPDKAVGLLGDMESREILNVDTVNRIAKAFVDRLAHGPAIEMLLYSLRLAPAQEVLKPMLEIIRAKRIKLGLFAEHEEKVRELRNYLEARFVVQTHFGSKQDSGLSTRATFDVSIFAGCGTLVESDAFATNNPIIALLDYEDLSDSRIEQVLWERIHTLIVPDSQVGEMLQDRMGTVPSTLRILTLPPCVEVESIAFADRKKGKRIAAFGPWSAHHNPMFLLQCMQKLHYLDPDMRLYLAGEFEDESIRYYTESMIETMELENTVFLDDIPKNQNRWLKDKHYIVSTAVDGRGLKGVLAGMAAGLRPLVHHFPGANDFVETDYLFVLAEEFCQQIIEGDYQPIRHRQMAVDCYSTLQVYPAILRILSEIEHCVLRQSTSASAPAPVETADSSMFQPGRQTISDSPKAEMPVSPPPFSSEISQPSLVPDQASSDSGTIEHLAHKALCAAKRLSELSQEHLTDPQDVAGVSEGGQAAVPFLQETR